MKTPKQYWPSKENTLTLNTGHKHTMKFAIHRLKKRALLLSHALSDWAAFIGIVLIGGIGSSWYLVSNGTALTTQVTGPWVMWTNEARVDADPYTRAHFAREATLNLSTQVASTFIARKDSDGVRLHSSCEYKINGKNLNASWWSLSVFDSSGRLIPNPIDRYAFTSDTVAISPNDQFVITLARNVQPGNWLPTTGAGRLTVVLMVLEGRNASVVNPDEYQEITLPEITKVHCR